MLSMPLAPQPGMMTGADGAATVARNPFPFMHKPNTLDRDRIVVPAGWDSWGKIVVILESSLAESAVAVMSILTQEE